MNYFSIESLFEYEQFHQISFEDFNALTKGRSIVSAADFGNNRFEIGLSGNLMLSFSAEENDNHINIVNTTNENEISPFAISLGNMPQQISLGTIEKKLKD